MMENTTQHDINGGVRHTHHENITIEQKNSHTSNSSHSEEEAAVALLLAAGSQNARSKTLRSFSLTPSSYKSGSEYNNEVNNFGANAELEYPEQYKEGNEEEVKQKLFRQGLNTFPGTPPITVTNYVSPTVSSSSSGTTDQDQAPQIESCTHGGSNSRQHFPSQLHEFLSSARSEHAGVVAEWLPQGLSWRVLRWDALKENVLQTYFPQCASDPDGFTWQINAWGFEEIRTGPERGSFRHDLFVRNQPELCHQMRINVDSLLETSDKAQPTYSPIVEAPLDTNCSPPQVVRHSYPLSSQISPDGSASSVHVRHGLASSTDQNVFRQRSTQVFITPKKHSQQDNKNINENGENDSPWLSLKQYQSSPRSSMKAIDANSIDSPNDKFKNTDQMHRRIISNSTAPTSHSPTSYYSEKTESNRGQEMYSGSADVSVHQIHEHSTAASSISPLKTEMRGLQVNKVPSTISLPESQSHNESSVIPLGMESSQPQSQLHSQSKPQAPKTYTTCPTGVRSSRGRSRSHIMRPCPHSPPSLTSTNQMVALRTQNAIASHEPLKKIFTVSSRGGSKQRTISNRLTKHVYTSPTKVQDMYNLQMFTNFQQFTPNLPSSSSSPQKLPHQASSFVNAKHQRSEDVVRTQSSYPIAIAVSRKTKRLRKTL